MYTSLSNAISETKLNQIDLPSLGERINILDIRKKIMVDREITKPHANASSFLVKASAIHHFTHALFLKHPSHGAKGDEGV